MCFWSNPDFVPVCFFVLCQVSTALVTAPSPGVYVTGACTAAITSSGIWSSYALLAASVQSAGWVTARAHMSIFLGTLLVRVPAPVAAWSSSVVSVVRTGRRRQNAWVSILLRVAGVAAPSGVYSMGSGTVGARWCCKAAVCRFSGNPVFAVRQRTTCFAVSITG